MTKNSVAIVGASGRMGSILIETLSKDSRFKITGLLENSKATCINTFYSAEDNEKILYTDKPEEALDTADVVIDFSLPKGTLTALPVAVNKSLPYVTGTTGFSADDMKSLHEAAAKIPLVCSSNMSQGVTLLKVLLRSLSSVLPISFDVELVERHHRYKQDSPSGTAIELVKIIDQARNLDEKNWFTGRAAGKKPRKKGEIAVHPVRGGGIIGEHSIFCISDSEEIQLTHRAFSRQVFADGAIEAALFVLKAKPGFYTMENVLGL